MSQPYRCKCHFKKANQKLDLYLSTKKVAKMQIDRNQKVAPSTKNISLLCDKFAFGVAFSKCRRKNAFVSFLFVAFAFLFNIVSNLSIGNLIQADLHNIYTVILQLKNSWLIALDFQSFKSILSLQLLFVLVQGPFSYIFASHQSYKCSLSTQYLCRVCVVCTQTLHIAQHLSCVSRNPQKSTNYECYSKQKTHYLGSNEIAHKLSISLNKSGMVKYNNVTYGISCCECCSLVLTI